MLSADRLLDQAPQDTSIFEAFQLADDVLRQAVQGISDIILTPGLINRDFSDVRSIMLGMGYAMMGTASASGAGAAIAAAEKAIACPLLEAGGVRGARGVLINITGSRRLGLHEVNQACTLIRNAADHHDVEINFGVVLDEAMQDEVKITVIATGFQRENLPTIQRRAKAAETFAAPAVPSPRMEMPPLEAKTEPVVVAADPPEAAWAEPAPPDTIAVPMAEPILEVVPHGAPAAAMAATAAATSQPKQPHVNGESLFEDLDMPAILRRDRRSIQ